MKVLPIVAGGALVLGVVFGAQWVTGAAEPSAAANTEQAVAPTTDTVTRRTLEHAEEFTGTIGYGETFSLPGTATGTVTWVPDKGDVLAPGDLLYRTDDRPTYWTKAGVPMYRELSSDSEGGDVAQLQRYLIGEGFLEADFEVEGKFNSATRTAVKEWQEDRGLKRSGRVDAAQLLFLPYDALRVESAPRLGDQASGGVLDVTLSDLYVTIDVSGRKKDVFDDATEIRVETANGEIHTAGVESIKAQPSQDEFSEQEYRVRLTLADETAQDTGQAGIEAVDILATDVLTVPARALIALVEGGFGVEVALDDTTTEYRAVEVGAFAGGWVEITGDVAEGDLVVVPE